MNKMSKRSLFIVILLIFTNASLCTAASLSEITNMLVKKTENSSVVEGIEDWLFLKEELAHIGSGRFWGDEAANVSRSKKKQYADPLPAILAYNKQLAEKGITLYLMPVPPKGLVYPDKLGFEVAGDVSAEQLSIYEEFFTLLRDGGVRVIDLLPVLLASREKNDVYCRTDTHFSPEGINLFAEAAAEVIKRTAWFSGVDKKEYIKSVRTVTIHGDLAQMAQLQDAKESIDLSFVTVKESGQPEVSDPDSPVILLGDSHTLVFNAGGDLHAKGAGLFDHLSSRLGFPVDLLGVRGSGVTPARVKLFQRSKKDKDYLIGKKVLIWCFTARDFTGSGGWHEIPVAP